MTSRVTDLPNRYPELGRLRSGVKGKTKDGKDKPVRIDTWRATSKDEARIRAFADTFGGEVSRWNDEHQCISTSDTLPVQIPPDALFVAYELWGSGGCQRRCDGERCQVVTESPDGGHRDEIPCQCKANGQTPGVDKSACSITLRLKVVLPQIPGIGAWMLTSGSIYAAMELPGSVALIESLRRDAGHLVDCDLVLEQRKEKRAYERYAREYNVPVLRINDSIDGLRAAVGSGPVRSSLTPAAAPQLAPGPPVAVPVLEARTGTTTVVPEIENIVPVVSEEDIDRIAPNYSPRDLIDLCSARGLETVGTHRERIVRLREAGVPL